MFFSVNLNAMRGIIHWHNLNGIDASNIIRLAFNLATPEWAQVRVFLCTILTDEPSTDDLNICFALFAILQGDAVNDIFYWKIAKKNRR